MQLKPAATSARAHQVHKMRSSPLQRRRLACPSYPSNQISQAS